MSEQLDKLYKLQKKDILKAGTVFADAFSTDPVWKKVLSQASEDQRRSFFSSPVKYCLKYGKIYAPSENIEGMAAWVSGDKREMTFWRGLLSGSIFYAMKVGKKILKEMQIIFAPLEAARRNEMAGREYIYLIILGVSPAHQGQGFGGKLLRAVIKESNGAGIPIYLETATGKNISMYEKFGFKKLNRIDHPIIDLPQWGMIREAD